MRLSRKRSKVFSELNRLSSNEQLVLSSLVGNALAGSLEGDIARELQLIMAGQGKAETAGRFAIERERTASGEKLGLADIASRERTGKMSRESSEKVALANLESQVLRSNKRLNYENELAQDTLSQRRKELPWTIGIGGLDVLTGVGTGLVKKKEKEDEIASMKRREYILRGYYGGQ